jgi:hypothetical protein
MPHRRPSWQAFIYLFICLLLLIHHTIIAIIPSCTPVIVLPFGPDINQLFCLLLLQNQRIFVPVRDTHFVDKFQ